MRLRRFIAIVFFSWACLAVPARADDPSPPPPPDTSQIDSQIDAQTYATQVNQAGSDQSLRKSAVTAMQALIQFGDSDLKSAFTNAYRAYGSFKNSENLDRAHKQALLAKASMGAPGTTNLSDQEMSFLTSATSYRRLDPAFLSSGDDAKIADDFEKKTGIGRADFLDMLSSLSENKLYASDPNLAQKVDAQIDSFLTKIPNGDFKAKAYDALALVPSLSRHQILAEAVQAMLKVASRFTAPSASGITSKGVPAQRNSASAEAERVPAAAGAKDPKDDSMDFLSRSLNSDVMAQAGEERMSKLDGVIRAAIHDDPENETIFEKISRRYRILTLDLAPPKEAKPSHDAG